jgi:hypothetical protein
MNQNTSKNATSAMLWRFNEIGLLELRAEPGAPLERLPLKEVLGAAARAGLWSPARAPRGMVRSG